MASVKVSPKDLTIRMKLAKMVSMSESKSVAKATAEHLAKTCR